MAELTGKDVYLRVTDNTTGTQSINHHRAWDADRVIEAQRQAHRDVGKKEGDPMRFTVTLATAKDYQQARGYRAA